MAGERIELRSRIGEWRCPLCQHSLQDGGERYRCPGCSTEYHTECANELGGCSTLGCVHKGERPSRVTTRRRRPRPAPTAARQADAPAARPTAARPTTAPRAGFLERLPDGRLKLELETPLESLWAWSSLLSGVAGFLALVNLSRLGPGPLIVAVVALAASLLLSANTDNYYLLDLERGELLYRRQVFSHVSVRRQASFGEIAGAGVDCRQRSNKERRWCEYALVVILRDGRTLLVSDWQEERRAALDRQAQELAWAVGGRSWGSFPERALSVRFDRRTGELRVDHPEPPSALVFAAVAMVLVAALIAIVTALLWKLSH
ncbi:MAG: hypothetical protein AB7N76_08430 [Planctomycetota bacterium]